MNQWHQMKTMLELMVESIPQRIESREKSCGPCREEEPRKNLSIRLDEVNLEDVFRDKAFMGLVLGDEPSPALFEKKILGNNKKNFHDCALVRSLQKCWKFLHDQRFAMFAEGQAPATVHKAGALC